MLECVLRQLPVHPRQWGMTATTCTELSEAVANLRELTAQAICDEHELQSIHEGGKLLMTLTRGGHDSQIEALRLIMAGVPLDTQIRLNGRSRTALVEAIALRRTEVALALIDGGAQLDLQDDGGRTALIAVIALGRRKVALALIAAGAHLDLQDDRGRTALIEGIAQGRTDVALALIDAGADLDLQDDGGRTALIYATMAGYTNVALALINAGAQLDLHDGQGMPAVMFANRLAQTQQHDMLTRVDSSNDRPPSTAIAEAMTNRLAQLNDSVTEPRDSVTEPLKDEACCRACSIM